MRKFMILPGCFNNVTIIFCIGELLYINLSAGQCCQRLGGSALAQVYKQIGNISPDLDDTKLFSRGFNAIQILIKGKISVHHFDFLFKNLLDLPHGSCSLKLN